MTLTGFTFILFIRGLISKGETYMSVVQKGILNPNKQGEKARILAFTIAKGGQLKSTSAANIAGAILKDKPTSKVLIIDVDAQANVFTTFGIEADMLEEHADLSGALLNVTDLKAALPNTVHRLYKNEDETGFIDGISANERCDLLEMTILTNLKLFKNPTTLLRELCLELENYYDFIVIDTPPSYSLIISNVFMIDRVEILVPFEPDTFSMRSVIKTIKTFDVFAQQNPTAKFSGVFATKLKKGTNVHGSIVNAVRMYTQSVNKMYLKTSIPNSVKSPNSVYFEALPAVLSTKKGDVVNEYLNLWEEIK